MTQKETHIFLNYILLQQDAHLHGSDHVLSVIHCPPQPLYHASQHSHLRNHLSSHRLRGSRWDPGTADEGDWLVVVIDEGTNVSSAIKWLSSFFFYDIQEGRRERREEVRERERKKREMSGEALRRIVEVTRLVEDGVNQLSVPTLQPPPQKPLLG